MTRRLILASDLRASLHKVVRVFTKPPAETKIVCIPTASNVYADKPWFHEEKARFQALGFDLMGCDLAGRSQVEIATKLKSADIVYVMGGNTYYLLENMQKCGFKQIMLDCLAGGSTYIGSSAGAVVACPTIDFIENMDDPAEAQLTDYTGLGLIDFKVLPHLDHPEMGAQAQTIVEKSKAAGNMLGLRDEQALFIDDDYMEIL